MASVERNRGQNDQSQLFDGGPSACHPFTSSLHSTYLLYWLVALFHVCEEEDEQNKSLPVEREEADPA